MAREQSLELPHSSSRSVSREHALDPVLLRLQSKVIQPSSIGQKRGQPRQVGQRRTAPQRERVIQRGDGNGRINRERPPGIPDERIEPARVELCRSHHQHVSRWATLQSLFAERPAKVRHVRVQRVASLIGRLLAPHLVDQHLGRHHLIGPQQQRAEHGSLLSPSQRQRAAPGIHLERAENPEQEISVPRHLHHHNLEYAAQRSLKERPPSQAPPRIPRRGYVRWW